MYDAMYIYIFLIYFYIYKIEYTNYITNCITNCITDLINMSEECYAWFSQIQKDRLYKYDHYNPHTNIYQTNDGREVEVTEICSFKDNHKERFKDSIYLGKVVKWLRIHKQK